MSKENEIHLSLSAAAARNLATATVTVPQYTEITPRWLHKLLPWVDVDGGVYRVNRVAKAAKGKPANEFGEVKVDLLTVDGGEPKLPTTFVDYEADPREYHLSTIQTVLRTHTRVTDLYSNKIDQLREQIRLTVEAVKEKEEWELINNPDFGLLKEVAPSQTIKTRKGSPTPDDLDELLALVWKKPAFFLAHPKAIVAFGREATRRGVPPPTVHLFGAPVHHLARRAADSEQQARSEESTPRAFCCCASAKPNKASSACKRPASRAKSSPACPSATWARTKTPSRRTSSRAISPPAC